MKTILFPYQGQTTYHFQSKWTENHSDSRPVIFEEDRRWLEILEGVVLKNLSNNHYTIRQLSNDMAISERHLRRRLKGLLDIGPKQYIKQKRLSLAEQLLYQRKYKTITQVAHAVGYRDVGSFRNNFSKHFGISPKSYLS